MIKILFWLGNIKNLIALAQRLITVYSWWDVNTYLIYDIGIDVVFCFMFILLTIVSIAVQIIYEAHSYKLNAKTRFFYEAINFLNFLIPMVYIIHNAKNRNELILGLSIYVLFMIVVKAYYHIESYTKRL